MTLPRTLANLVILADGSLGLFGGHGPKVGGNCPFVVTPEVMKPQELFGIGHTGWQPMVDASVERGYHQVALLLPDGSVWVAGGEGPGGPGTPSTAWHSYEKFKPRYMFNGPRPVITGAGATSPGMPGVWQLPGGTGGILFEPINVTGFGFMLNPDIVRAHLIRPGSSTHHQDNHQRFIQLPIKEKVTQPDGSIDVNVLLPPNAFVAPPGYYMLFVVLSNGNPSIARLIRIVG